MAVVIIGGGIIGWATAFYLTREPSATAANSIHVVESTTTPISSASGYAAGFIARDWFSHSSAALGALSFGLHKELAEKHGGAEKWGYSRSTSASFERNPFIHGENWVESGSRAEVAGTFHEAKPDSLPTWLKRTRHDELDVIGRDDAAAQVDPLRLSTFLLETATTCGVHYHGGAKPVSISLSSENSPTSITIASSTDSTQTTQLPCSRLIITAGAWTPTVYETLFPHDSTRIPISQLAGHSLLLRTSLWKAGDELVKQQANGGLNPSPSEGGCHAVFTSAVGPDGRGDWSPELFSRAGGEIYIAGLNDPALRLPELATDRKLEPEKLKILMEEAGRLIGVGDAEELEVLREGLCFRPVTKRGTPIVAQVRPRVWVAAGHGPWGISMSLGTGKVVSEMVEGRVTSADVSGLGL